MEVKDRRKALGLSRAELAAQAHVDKGILQVMELGYDADAASVDRVRRALDALEKGHTLPDFATEVAADIEATGRLDSGG